MLMMTNVKVLPTHATKPLGEQWSLEPVTL